MVLLVIESIFRKKIYIDIRYTFQIDHKKVDEEKHILGSWK